MLGTLWAADHPLTPGEVRDQLDPDLAYTTVMTILTRLLDKGMVVRERQDGSRAYAYAPAVDHAEHAAIQMHEFLASDDDREAVFTRFVGRLTAAERRALSKVLTTGQKR